MQNLQAAFVVFLAFLIGVNCVNFENSTSDGETTHNVFDMCKAKCGDDPYTYCKGNQDWYETTKCVCPIKTQVLITDESYNIKCISWCIHKCGEGSRTVCSGDQTTYGTTICGCKGGLNWNYGRNYGRCLRCLCEKGVKCTTADFYPGTMQCKECREGYSAVNGTCKGDCRSSPCKNGGRCRIEAEDITCDCVDPFTGEFCEKSVHCDPNPCMNGGTCISTEDTFECVCPDIYGGRTCSENIFCEKYGEEYCGKVPCHVSENPTKVHCICEDEQAFDRASRSCINDDCDPNPCKNGGTCWLRGLHYPGDPYTCFCRSTHMGKNCTESTWCMYNGRSECGNESICQYDENSGKVSCNCIDVHEKFDKKSKTCKGICNPNPCVHGICIPDGKYDYYCSCFNSYRGKNCNEGGPDTVTIIVVVIVPLGVLGMVIALVLIRKRNQKLRMRSQHMRMNQTAMPVRVGLN